MAEPVAETRLMTADEFAALPDDGVRRELVKGEVVTMAPTRARHSQLSLQLMGAVLNWVSEHGGVAMGQEPAVIVEREPDTVLAPDGAFFTPERMSGKAPNEYLGMVPDLVLEVVSPGDRTREVLAKAVRWLDAGVKVLWVAWPDDAALDVYNGDAPPVRLGPDDTLTCEELMPGFALDLGEVL
jgi:Uma2 family endonuclease